MPFRERVRKAFGRTPSGTTTTTTITTTSATTSTTPATATTRTKKTERPGSEVKAKRSKAQRANVYRIGDPLPPPKYPGKWDKPHQDMLRAFSFANAFSRRRSEQTDVSPMNSRWASRKNSEVGTGALPGGRRSMAHQRGPSNIAHGVLVDGEDGNDIGRDETANGTLSRPNQGEAAAASERGGGGGGGGGASHRRNAYVVVSGLDPHHHHHVHINHDNADHAHAGVHHASSMDDGRGRPSQSSNRTGSAYYTADESHVDHADDDDDDHSMPEKEMHMKRRIFQ